MSHSTTKHYSQPLAHLAALKSQLAATFQEPNDSSYGLKHVSLLTQSQTDFKPEEGDSDHLTGHSFYCKLHAELCCCCCFCMSLCACLLVSCRTVLPHLKVFVSSSLDKKRQMWDEENRLLRLVIITDVRSSLSVRAFVCISDRYVYVLQPLCGCCSSRTLQLNAVPERLAYSVFGGDVFLGIREGLYVMSCTKFLPPNYQQTVRHSSGELAVWLWL